MAPDLNEFRCRLVYHRALNAAQASVNRIVLVVMQPPIEVLTNGLRDGLNAALEIVRQHEESRVLNPDEANKVCRWLEDDLNTLGEGFALLSLPPGVTAIGAAAPRLRARAS